MSAAVCFISFLRFRDRERDRALLARLDIGEEAKKQIKETMDSAPGGKLLLAFLIAGTVLSGIVRDEVLYFSELRQIEIGDECPLGLPGRFVKCYQPVDILARECGELDVIHVHFPRVGYVLARR